MAYRFNQFRRSGQNFSQAINNKVVVLETIPAFSDVPSGIVFADKKIIPDTALQPTDQTGTKKKNYFLRLKVYCRSAENDTQSISIRLYNSKETDLEKAYQNIENIKVPSSSIKGDFRTYDIVIPPNNVYDEIHLILNRNMTDFTVDFMEEGYQGRALKVEVLKLEELKNIILDSSILVQDAVTEGKLKQIGVQGPPGLQMCIDGEQIRLGRSGLYEINNGIAISFLSFIVSNDDNKYFILDYQY